MKNQVLFLIVGLSIGMLIMINQVCRQKDSTIRLLMKNSNNVESIQSCPKNLPILNIK